MIGYKLQRELSSTMKIASLQITMFHIHSQINIHLGVILLNLFTEVASMILLATIHEI